MSARKPMLRPLALLRAPDHRHDAGLADAAVVLDAQARQRLLDDARGPVLLEAQFRMRVQVAADGGELVVPAADVFVGFHQAAAVLSMRKRGSTA